jgi:hypothetical protein
MGYSGDLNALDTDEMDLGGILYQPSLHAEERQLLEALFACYGPDPRTICRLLCRPDASLEVQVSTPTLAYTTFAKVSQCALEGCDSGLGTCIGGILSPVGVFP